MYENYMRLRKISILYTDWLSLVEISNSCLWILSEVFPFKCLFANTCVIFPEMLFKFVKHFDVNVLSRCALPSMQVIPCAQRDALYCLHDNGCVTLRVCRSTALSAEETGKRFFPFPLSFAPCSPFRPSRLNCSYTGGIKSWKVYRWLFKASHWLAFQLMENDQWVSSIQCVSVKLAVCQNTARYSEYWKSVFFKLHDNLSYYKVNLMTGKVKLS